MKGMVAMTLLTNGRIFLGTGENDFAKDLRFADGKVVETGDDLKPAEGEEVIDAKGRLVLPGLIDAHTHPKYIADALHGVACTPPDVNSIAEMQAALRHSPAFGAGKDVWIEGWGFDETKLKEHRSPTRADLDQVSTDQPIFIYRSDCHSSVGNSRALELAGIDRTTPDPVGGKIERDDAGEPTGFMREVAATQLLIRAKSAQSYQADVDNLVQSSHHYLANGIVAIGEMMGRKKPYNSWQLYTDAVTRGFLPRTTIYYVFDELKDGAALSFKATDQLRVAGIKVFMDGSISGETADNTRPYPDGKRGVLLTDQDKLLAAVEMAKAAKVQLAVHAMGDAAIQLVLDTTANLTPWLSETPSVRIEHASLLTDAMFDQINRAKMNYGLVTQPIFFFAEVASYQVFLTSSQYQEIYRVKSMERSKALVALSSDAPCTPWAEPDSVFYSLYAAVTRRAANGEVVGPEEAITVGTGLLAYTKDAALMGGFEKNGTLVAGKNADFVIVDQDLFTIDPTEIKDTRVAETWVAGQRVYQRAVGEGN
ncbi:amidohydrolase [Limosilactobacillus fermentum]|uniref:amidohydrolase n=1 Tax=Limosilactobacillus fermentum TaxID=1613 RepID=UPI003BA8A6B7